MRAAWELSNGKNDELAQHVFNGREGALSKEQYKRYFNNNTEALTAFLQRKEQGLNLSDRVWRYTNAFKSEIEMALDLGIRDGKNAASMSRSVREYLKYPDKLFRRVRDQHGLLQLSKAAQAFHPGQGVYRSSYKNARRLAATETNIAYRTADHLRWQQMDFVVGIEIQLSNNHTILLQPGERTDDPTQQRADGSPKANAVRPLTDICDTLAGRYPKDFKFTGWHPHCRCRAITILKTPEEIRRDTQRILRGEQPLNESENTVTELPDNFKQWVKENSARIEQAKGLPYFLRDNGNYISSISSIGDSINGNPNRPNADVSKKSIDTFSPPMAENYAYYYNGKVRVSLFHGENELDNNLQLALLTANYTDSTVWLLPRIDPKQKDAVALRTKYLPKEVFTNKNPDFFIEGKLYDGKKIESINEDYEFKKLKSSIENHIKKAKLQAENMIFALPPYIRKNDVDQIIMNYLRRSKTQREIIVFIGDSGNKYTS